jgi:hypothetical protein
MTSVEHSPLTRKLSAFVALSEVELTVLERLHQRRRTFVAGRDMVHQGQTDQAAYILSSGLGLFLQAPGRRNAPDRRFPGARGLPRVAQRSLAHLGPQLRAHRGHRGCRSAEQRSVGSVRADPALGDCHSLGGVAGRGDGRRASRRDRPARCGRPHGAFPAGAGIEAVRWWAWAARKGYDCPLTQYHLADARRVPCWSRRRSSPCGPRRLRCDRPPGNASGAASRNFFAACLGSPCSHAFSALNASRILHLVGGGHLLVLLFGSHWDCPFMDVPRIRSVPTCRPFGNRTPTRFSGTRKKRATK